MWKLLLTIPLMLFSIGIVTNPAPSEPITAEEAPAPSYAKWGQVAMKKTKEKYPDAKIIDYLHIGAITRNGETTEKFKLWLRGKDREFGVYIDIRYTKKTEEVIDIKFQETDR
ncbi:DUF3889 domain-containing protein [Oceanobacillus indicireducens]|uniref:DUF3889 domain-containing protein n=1 Tax=Oceanobacillus indicireducens TaxID=1004261 RepID=A0A917XYX3_9BACI|nr:DUF3889 domain-containing protein [Oceanobacillus indicireducens]GGN57590.1 hypothetical protein GCM10007971_18690 [Oceanobacillus indicireducens]